MKRIESRYVRILFKITIFLCIITLVKHILPPLSPVRAEENNEANKNYVISSFRSINSKAGIILCTESGSILYSQNPNVGFVPASVIKVLTSLSARHYLGDDYRFTTDFFIDGGVQNGEASNRAFKPDSSAINLKIKGYGDPLFTSAIIHDSCRQVSLILKSMNIAVINDLIVDNTFFAPDIKIDGTSNTHNPYDAFVGSLSANFNTVSFKYNNDKKEYVSDDLEIPILPFVMNRVKSSWFREGRVILSEQESKIYAGMLIHYFLSQEGIIIKGQVKAGVVTAADKPVYKVTSPYDINEIIRRLLKYSSNFMANQLFLSAGAKAFSPPATVEKGVAAMARYANRVVGISLSDNFRFTEGAGLSRQNRISPSDMVKILGIFRKDYQLMKNETVSDGCVEYYKTGTLTGVKTRCGYLQTSRGLYPFVIMINELGIGYDKMRQFLWRTVLAHEDKK